MLRPKKRNSGALECPTKIPARKSNTSLGKTPPTITTQRKKDPRDIKATYHTVDVPNDPARSSGKSLVSVAGNPSGIARSRTRNGVTKTVDRYIGEDGKKYKTTTRTAKSTGAELSSRTTRTPFVRNPQKIKDLHTPDAVQSSNNVIDSNTKRIMGGSVQRKRK